MEITYKNNSVKKICTSEKEAKRFFDNKKYIEELQSVINYIKLANNLSDVANFKPYHFHPTDFYIKHSFAIDIGGRTSKYRLIVIPLDDENKIIVKDENFAKKCKEIRILEIEEVSKHYEH